MRSHLLALDERLALFLEVRQLPASAKHGTYGRCTSCTHMHAHTHTHTHTHTNTHTHTHAHTHTRAHTHMHTLP